LPIFLPRLPRAHHIRAFPVAARSRLLLRSSPPPKHRSCRRVPCVYAMLKPGSCLAGVWGRPQHPRAKRCSAPCSLAVGARFPANPAPETALQPQIAGPARARSGRWADRPISPQ
jgi:hypothetical protein